MLQTPLVLVTSFFNRLDYFFLRSRVLLQTGSKKRLTVKNNWGKLKKRKLLLEEQNRGTGSESGISVWLMSSGEKPTTRRRSTKSLASSVRVRHAVMALTSATRIAWRNFHFTCIVHFKKVVDLCADFENCHLLRRLPAIICVLQISSEVRNTSKFSHMLVLEERNITSLGTCNIFLTMTVNAISPKYCPPRMSASPWSLPTGSKSSGREQWSLRFPASLGGKTEASLKERTARVHAL